jgi:hypothetical protein
MYKIYEWNYDNQKLFKYDFYKSYFLLYKYYFPVISFIALKNAFFRLEFIPQSTGTL